MTLSAPLAGNRTARKLQNFSQKVKKSKSFRLSFFFRLFGWFFRKKPKSQKGLDFLTFRPFRWNFSRKIKKCSAFRLLGFLNFRFFRLFEHKSPGLGTLMFFSFFFDFSTFRFFRFSTFRPEKGKFWPLRLCFYDLAIQNRQQVLNLANFSTRKVIKVFDLVFSIFVQLLIFCFFWLTQKVRQVICEPKESKR